MKIFCMRIVKDKEFLKYKTIASRVEKVTNEMGVVQKVNDEQVSIIKRLRADLKIAKGKLDATEEDLSKKGKELIQMGSDLSDLKTKESFNKEQIRKLIESNREKKERIKDLESQNLEDDRIKKEKDDQINAMVRKLKELTDKNTALVEYNNELKDRVEALEKELQTEPEEPTEPEAPEEPEVPNEPEVPETPEEPTESETDKEDPGLEPVPDADPDPSDPIQEVEAEEVKAAVNYADLGVDPNTVSVTGAPTKKKRRKK